MQHIAESPVRDAVIKTSGVVSGGTAFAGLTADLSGWSEIAQIAANFGIALAAVTAFGTFVYTVYKGSKKKDA